MTKEPTDRLIKIEEYILKNNAAIEVILEKVSALADAREDHEDRLRSIETKVYSWAVALGAFAGASVDWVKGLFPH